MPDKVSVIVPIYNVKEYLPKCIESILAQTYDNIELLLVDDCSTDGSDSIARAYAENNPQKCRFIQMESNSGVSCVRNRGIDESTGTWLAFVDSDDWVSPEYVSAMYDIACADGADMVMSGCTYAWDDGRLTEMAHPPIETSSTHREKVAFCRCCMTAKLIRKQLVLDTGIRLPLDIHRLEELSVIAPLVSYTDKVSITHQPYYYYYQRQTSSSHQNTKKTDTEVFWRSVDRMYRLAAPGFEREMEYHAICELLYGATTVLLRAGRSRREFIEHIDRFVQKYPDWVTNPYLSKLLVGKRVFVKFAVKKQFAVLKLLIFAWDMKQKIF